MNQSVSTAGDFWGDPGVVTTHGDGWVHIDFPRPDIGVSVKVETVAGLPQVVGLHIEKEPPWQPPPGAPDIAREAARLLRLANEAHDGPWHPVPFSRRQLQALPMGQLRDIALHHGPRTRKFAGPGPVRPPRRGPQPVPRALLERVADIYKDECALHHNPSKRIQRDLDIRPATVQKYVRLCRKLGLLGWPAKVGLPGHSEAKPPGYQHEARRAPSPPSSIT
jgi:hypothetical protein